MQGLTRPSELPGVVRARTCSTLPKEDVCTLELIDGSKYKGFSFGAKRSVAGEVVFNTGMVGYPESLTDPSYRGQMLIITYPLVGNYGIPSPRLDKWGLSENFESDDIHIRCMIISDYSHQHSHWAAVKSLSQWLKDANIPGIYGLDTRAITKKIRNEGVMLGRLTFGDQPVPNFQGPNDFNLINEVSLKTPKIFGPDRADAPKVIVVDVGVKNNIVRCLVERGASVKVVPWNYNFNQEEYDGLFVSNGPGAPWMAGKTIEHMRTAMNDPAPKPIMGICLGNQLMALASGAKTFKMQFGNRAQNVPCIDQETYRCYITPQNHGYAVDNRTLSPEWRPYFINANDGSNEGIKHVTKPFYAVQFHPEAEGGPYDTSFLFDHFIANARKYQRNRLGWTAGGAPGDATAATATSSASGAVPSGKRAYHTSTVAAGKVQKRNLAPGADATHLRYTPVGEGPTGPLYGRDVVTSKIFDRPLLENFLGVASDMRRLVEMVGHTDVLRGYVLGNLFMEPSTRTASSFAAAMYRLGGQVISLTELGSSAQKGETLQDTVRAMQNYCDVLVLRHKVKGAAQTAAEYSVRPVINAGDGPGEHPTQALTDLVCIMKELGTLDNINVTLVGDLKFGRTVHSLCEVLKHFKARITCVAPAALAMPDYVLDNLKKNNVPVSIHTELTPKVLGEADILYVTRVQQERFTDPAEYQKLKDTYIITPQVLTHCKKKMAVMHPLPRVNEIAPEVDVDPRAAYFRQMQCGMLARMALFTMILGQK